MISFFRINFLLQAIGPFIPVIIQDRLHSFARPPIETQAHAACSYSRPSHHGVPATAK